MSIAAWMKLLKRNWPAETQVRRVEVPVPVKDALRVPVEYRSLYQYLERRYADTVVLTFSQIEDLIGSTLPDLARLRQDWWANTRVDGGPPAQSHSWMQAGRSATPNLVARIVTFERVPA